MKHFIIFLTLIFTSLSAQAQFAQAIGLPDHDFRATQIRTLGVNTYVSGWLTDPNAPAPALSSEGVIVRLDAMGAIDWMYQLSSDNQGGIPMGTRIYDFDFDDGTDHIVFVGATTDNSNGIVNNQSILGMLEVTSGVDVFQQSYDFRNAREFFFKIVNNPSTNPADTSSYIISGLINDNGVGTVDNYVNGRAVINTAGATFNWIQECDITFDEEMQRMRVLEVMNNLEIVQLGTALPGLNGRINFHDINNGAITNELVFNLPGMVMDAAQIGDTMIVVGQLNNPLRAFIAAVDLQTNLVTSNLVFSDINSFSRVIADPISRDILAVGEHVNSIDNSTICRFNLGQNQLFYNGANVLDFGTNSPGNGLLAVDGNDAYFADTRTMLAAFGVNQSVAITHTDLDFASCDTLMPTFTPQPVNLTLTQQNVIDITPLIEPIPVSLALANDTLCNISLCGNGFNLNTIIPVFHGSKSHHVNVADIDNDGWQDFAVPDIGFGGTPRFNISENNQNLTFTNIPSTNSNLLYDREAKSMQFIDLYNNTGDLDIVVLRGAYAEVFIESAGAGTYSLHQTIPLTPFPLNDPSNILGIERANFKLVDYTNNGQKDLIVTGPETGGNPLNRIVLFEGTGTGSATTPYFNPVPMVTLAGLESIKYWETLHDDINVDGNFDLLIGEADYNQATQSIFGYLHTGINNAPFPANPNLTYETPTGFIWPRGMELIDIDGNNQLDLIVSMQTVALNGGIPTGEGALIIARDVPSAPGNYTTANLQWEVINIPGQPVGIDIDDIDGDGFNDIAVAVHNGTNTPSFVRIYDNDGTGNFFNFIDIITPIGQTIELQIADFNNDCCLDVVTTQWNGAMSYVLINDCQATEFTIRGQVVCESDPCDFLQMSNNGVPNQSIVITDGTITYVAITNSNGEYNIDVPAGSYDISVLNANYGAPNCINANTADVTNFQPAMSTNSVDFIIKDECELDVTMVGGLSGFAGTNTCPYVATPCDSLIWEYCFEIENNTCSDQVIDDISIDLPHGVDVNTVMMNPLVECISQTQVSTIAPSISTISTNLFGSTVDYNLNSSLIIPSGDCFSACVQATFIGNFVLPVTAEVNVDYTCNDGTNPGTTSGIAYQDTCSCDPNLKLAYFPQNCGTLDELLDQPIEYTIQFINIGQTAAYDIRVLDQLDNNLDWSTFQWVGSSHPSSSISLTNGLLEVYFNNINLAPGAIGWLRFSVKPDGSTTNGTSIYNFADIIFDNNAPVSTNTTETIIQASIAQADLQFNALEFCVGDKIVIDYTWTGDAAWINYSQNGLPLGQNVTAPSSGSQVVFTIPNNSYVGLWEYELIAYDSITGCADTAQVVLNIYDCDCELDDQIFMGVGNGSYQFVSEIFDPILNPGFTITNFKWHLGDGTVSTDQSPIHQYNCKKLGPHAVKVCLYYEAEINGIICEGEICQWFEVCEKGKGKKGNAAKANIYPNPASNEVTIQSEALQNQTDELTVEAYTFDGRLLSSNQIKSENDRVNLKFNHEYKGLVHIRILNSLGEILLEDRFLRLKTSTY